MVSKSKLGIVFLLFSFVSLAESREELIRKFMKERQKIMKEMMDSFQSGSFYSDNLIDSFDKDFFGNSNFMNNIDVVQKNLPDGSIEVKITPKNKNLKLDIETTADHITIKSKILVETKDESKQGKSFSKSSSTSSQRVGIPYGYEVSTPKQEGDSIVYVIKRKKLGKQPVQKTKGAKTI